MRTRPDRDERRAAGDRARVAELLGRQPRGEFRVVARDPDGDPVVIRNAPLLADGTPMPTRYWLVGATLRRAVDRLEAAGGVRAAEAALDPAVLAGAHARYAGERDAAIGPGWSGARPAGGVGGTRRGVKCLHAHYAWYLAGGEDPVGRWVDRELGGASRSVVVAPAPPVSAPDECPAVGPPGTAVGPPGVVAGAAGPRW